MGLVLKTGSRAKAIKFGRGHLLVVDGIEQFVVASRVPTDLRGIYEEAVVESLGYTDNAVGGFPIVPVTIGSAFPASDYLTSDWVRTLVQGSSDSWVSSSGSMSGLLRVSVTRMNNGTSTHRIDSQGTVLVGGKLTYELVYRVATSFGGTARLANYTAYLDTGGNMFTHTYDNGGGIGPLTIADTDFNFLTTIALTSDGTFSGVKVEVDTDAKTVTNYTTSDFVTWTPDTPVSYPSAVFDTLRTITLRVSATAQRFGFGVASIVTETDRFTLSQT